MQQIHLWTGILHSSLPTYCEADNGTIHMWDWRTGYNFQRIHAAVQPGSLDSESGIFACVFDHSESRLITAEADKTIKVYKEDDTAVSYTVASRGISVVIPQQWKHHFATLFSFLQTEESHPVNWKPEILKRKRFWSSFCLFVFFSFLSQ